MIERIFKKQTPLGEIKVVLRIIGKQIYFKFNNHQHTQQMVEKLKARGVGIRMGNGWMEVDLFKALGSESVLKLGNIEIDTEEDSLEVIENKLNKFYTASYIQQGFELI